MKIEIPGAPPMLLNARLHWREKNRLKLVWYTEVDVAVRRHVPPEPFERACISYTRCCGYREPDYDNLVSGWKWIQDGLVNSGLICDDRMTDIETFYHWHPASQADKRVIIEIEPIL